MVDDPPDDAVALQLPKLLDQHLLRDRRYSALKIGETKHLLAEQMEENHQLLTALQKFERLLNAARGGDWRVFAFLTRKVSTLLSCAFLPFCNCRLIFSSAQL